MLLLACSMLATEFDVRPRHGCGLGGVTTCENGSHERPHLLARAGALVARLREVPGQSRIILDAAAEGARDDFLLALLARLALLLGVGGAALVAPRGLAGGRVVVAAALAPMVRFVPVTPGRGALVRLLLLLVLLRLHGGLVGSLCELLLPALLLLMLEQEIVVRRRVRFVADRADGLALLEPQLEGLAGADSHGQLVPPMLGKRLAGVVPGCLVLALFLGHATTAMGSNSSFLAVWLRSRLLGHAAAGLGSGVVGALSVALKDGLLGRVGGALFGHRGVIVLSVCFRDVLPPS